MNLRMRYYGDPVLRELAEPVTEITDEIRTLAHQMIDLMRSVNAIGLAATQVGHLVRLFVSNVDYEDEQGEVHYCDPLVYINPILTNPSNSLIDRLEGCTSFPKLYLPIIRPVTIDVEAMDLNGNSFKKSCYGYKARNMMHETDHLNGVLFIDRIKGKKRSEIEPDLRRIRQHYYEKNK